MKKISYILLAILTIAFTSCKSDPWDEVTDGDWNHQRSVMDIAIEGQAGSPEFEILASGDGVITLTVAADLVEDVSALAVTKLDLSYQATSSIAVGSVLDLSTGSTTFTVTSQTGKTRTYTLQMEAFAESFVGTYSIDELWVYGGTGPEYGGAACLQPSDKPWNWTTAGEGPAAELDNTLTITLSGILDNGNTTGTAYYDAGDDGKSWDCIFIAAQSPNGVDEDLSKFYRRIPQGESTWVRDYSNNTITFTAADGTKSVASMLGSGEFSLYSGISMNVPNQAFSFECDGVDDWGNIYKDYDKFAARPRKYFMCFSKIGEGQDNTGGDTTDEGNTGDEQEQEADDAIVGTYDIDKLWVYGGTGPEYGGGAVQELNDGNVNYLFGYQVSSEYDNVLVFTQTGKTDAGYPTGTCDNQAGDDGYYWEPKFYFYSQDDNHNLLVPQAIADEAGITDENKADHYGDFIDVSSFYRQIPTGESTWIRNTDDGTIRFIDKDNNETVATLLETGTVDLYGASGDEHYKSLDVANQAFMFDCAGVDDWSNNYTAYDKMAKNPRKFIVTITKR